MVPSGATPVTVFPICADVAWPTNLLQYGFLDFSPLTDPALRQVDLAVPSTLTLFREPPPPVSEPPPFTSVQQLCREHTSSRHEERPTRNHSPL